jgi:hypothetical protein
MKIRQERITGGVGDKVTIGRRGLPVGGRSVGIVDDVEESVTRSGIRGLHKTTGHSSRMIAGRVEKLPGGSGTVGIRRMGCTELG